jgi:hypothetical protein
MLHPVLERHRAATRSSTAMRRSWRPSSFYRTRHLHRLHPATVAPPFAATHSGQCRSRPRPPPPQAGTAPAAGCPGTRHRRRWAAPAPSPWPRRKRRISPCHRACSCGLLRRARRGACRPRSSAGGTPCRGTAAASGCSCCSSRTWCWRSCTAGTSAAAGAAGASAPSGLRACPPLPPALVVAPPTTRHSPRHSSAHRRCHYCQHRIPVPVTRTRTRRNKNSIHES